MKPTPFRKTGLATAFIALALSPASPLYAQVTIPAQSASSRESADPPETEPARPPVAPMQRQAPLSRTSSPPVPAGPARPEAPVVPPRPGDSVAAMQRVPEPVQTVDLALIERLAELRRELRIAESARVAKIALPSDELFLRSRPEDLDPYALSTLRKVLEYIELNPRQAVTLRSFHPPGNDASRSLAASRAETVIAWLRENATIDAEQFRADPPEPLPRPTPRISDAPQRDSEYIARFEFLLSQQ